MGERLRKTSVRVLLLAMAVAVTSGCAVWKSGGLFDGSEPIGGPCRRIPVPVGGPEDIAPDPAGGFFVSASDWRARAEGRAPRRGAIYRLELDPGADQPRLRDVTPAVPVDFQPHGIDLWTGSAGDKRLFVVSHPLSGPSRVDIFEVGEDGALTLSADGGAWPVLHRPNDVAAFGRASFFATNDHDLHRTAWFRPSLLEQAEDFTGWPGGSVVRVDARGAEVVARGLALANGLALSLDGRSLFVAESAMGRISVFEGLGAARLRPAGRIQVGPGPDNLVVDAAGDLWVGAHNNGLEFFRHVRRAAHPSPGRVVRLSPGGGAQIIYQSGRAGAAPGTPKIWATSAGAPAGRDRVLVGNIFTPALEFCAIQQTAATR